MSVYKRDYRGYSGNITPRWTRVYVLAKYSWVEAWASKITVGLCVLSLLPFLIFLVGIYLANNPIARIMVSAQAVKIDARYFLVVLQVQSWLALVITSWVAPRLISFDLSDNALPILLSHPISRFGYVFGKFLALLACLSLVTWVPGLLLFVDQSYSSAQPWGVANLPIAMGLLAGSVIWITFLSILGLAVSSWVKWKVVATGAIFAAVFVPAGVGAIMSAILRTRWGFLLNLPMMMSVLWQRLLRAPNTLPEIFRLPTFAIATMLVVVCLLCLAMLNARIRAREVVRG